MITVRAATEADLPAILGIYNEVIANTTAVYYYDPHTLEMRQQWFNERKAQGFPIFVAEENKEVIGMSTIGPFRVHAAYRYTVENTIHIAAHARGRGVAKLLMPPLIDAAKEMGLHCIVAGIDADNKASIALHQKFGFETVAHFKEVGYKFDRWLDLVFMQKIL